MLLCIWLYAIVLIPKMMELVIKDGGGRGSVRRWTPAQVLNTMLLTTHAIIEATTLAYTYSIYRWSRKDFDQDRQVSWISSVDLRGLVYQEIVQMCAVFVLFFLELFTEWLNREYIFILPMKLMAGEVYTIFYC